MSTLYSTKSLGRSWVPSPGRARSGRFGTWPPTQKTTRQDERRYPSPTALRLRGRPAERFVVVALLMLIIAYSTLSHSNFLVSLHSYTVRYPQQWRHRSKHIELADEASWSDFAYSTYATDTESLCNSVMLLESLHRLDVNADRLLLFSNTWNISDTESQEAKLLNRASTDFGAHLQPVEIMRQEKVADPTWMLGFTKLLAFNQTQYKRVLSLDSDATILRSMDEIFLMPPAPVAMPRAYWLDDTLCNDVTLVQPSASGFAAIQERIAERSTSEYDMDVINAVYGDSCAVLPHRPYNLLTGEFRAENHTAYLGPGSEAWDAEAVMQEAKYVHFSDWPLPKPWRISGGATEQDIAPKCVGGGAECGERRIWDWLYRDFRERRKRVCDADFAPWE